LWYIVSPFLLGNFLKEQITNYTGTKLSDLENLDSMVKFFDSLLEGDSLSISSASNLESLSLISNQLLNKTKDAISPISQALYSSITVYKKKSGYLIHVGANIDPSSKDLLKIPEYRNCAEKQAAISAYRNDQESNDNLKILFLYRKPNGEPTFPAEKLIPCKDCYQSYLQDLQRNMGKLVLILSDNVPREFINANHCKSKEINLIKSIESKTFGLIYYVIIPSDAISYLNIEKELGARVCAD
jgi:cytidine deaminase